MTSATLQVREHPPGGQDLAGDLHHPLVEPARKDPHPVVRLAFRYAGLLETATERFALEDVTVARVTIPRGALVYAALASAKRDGQQFPDPDRLDLAGDPNRHLAIGLGPHFCLGAPLARLEGQVAIGTLVRRAADLRLAVPPAAVRWRRGLVIRRAESLPVAVTRWV